jgi:hypothetical protein
MIKKLKDFKNCYQYGKDFVTNSYHLETLKKSASEKKKQPSRTDIINYILSLFDGETTYLEIGVRNPNDNFNQIKASAKYSVDPGVEFKENPVDFKLTSDHFFEKLNKNEILSNDIRFDVIFIDGLHLAEQVILDIKNSLKFINEDGFILLHDCNPPTEWHAREEYNYTISPAQGLWNGTTWKAFFKTRFEKDLKTCCIDSDWGVGVISKKRNIGSAIEPTNLFYEFKELDKNRKNHLNLVTFEEFKKNVSST